MPIEPAGVASANSMRASGTLARAVARDPRDGTPLVVGVTSHRNLPSDQIAPVRQRVREFFAGIREKFPEFPLVVLSPLAEGGDQWVAEEALAVGARLIAPLPMSRESYVEDFADPAARARFDRLCDMAEVVEIPEVVGIAPPTRADIADEVRDQRYAQAGMYVSDHAHILLAVWDGKDSSMLGGTAQIVRYHLSGIKPSYAERRRSDAHVLGDENERLVYHIVCSRDQADGEPQPALRALDVWWRVGAEVLPGTLDIPDSFRSMLASAREFAEDARKYAVRIDAAAKREVRYDGRHPDLASERWFVPADWLARHFQRRVLLSMRVLYTMAAMMGISFAAYDNLPAQDGMIFVFLLLFVLGGSVALLANRRGWHRKYLDYRALAEGLRVQSYWHRAGLSLADDPQFGRDNFLQKQDVELGWVRNAMRFCGIENDLGGKRGSAQDVQAVIGEWIGDDTQPGQLDYYRNKGEQRARTHRLTERIGAVCLFASVGLSFVLAVFVFRLSNDAKNDLIVLMAVFSVVAGVRSAYAHKKADKELIKQYRYMQRIFGEARDALDHAVDTEERRDILRQLGEAALAEQVEWTLMHRQRPLEHNRI